MIVSLSIPEELLSRFDEQLRSKGFNSRSDAVREAMRSFVDEAEWESQDGDNQIVITAIYSEPGPKGELSILQHRFEEIQMMLHLHLERSHCMELIIANGPNVVLREILAKVRRVKGIHSIRFISTSHQVS